MKSRPMKVREALSKYGYSLIGAGLAALILTVLGFALVSSIRHLLWIYMMKGSHMPPLWLWAGVTLIAFTILVLWYRMMSATLWQAQQRRRFYHRIKPLLKPFPQNLHPELLRVADWYLIDDDQDRFAFTWGIKRARIAVSQGLWEALDESAKKAVLYHELAHALAHDPLQQSFLQVLSQALRPLGAGYLYQRYMLKREILADSLAISACEGDDVPLLTALLVATETAATDDLRVGLAGALEERIAFIETGRLPNWRDQNVQYQLLSTGVAIMLTVGEGLLVWCH